MPTPQARRSNTPWQLTLAVDGRGMFDTQQKQGWFFDPRRLLAFAQAQEGLELGSAFWYAGPKDATDQRPFRDALTGLGLTVRTKPLRELEDGISANSPEPISIWRLPCGDCIGFDGGG